MTALLIAAPAALGIATGADWPMMAFGSLVAWWTFNLIERLFDVR